MQVEQAKGFLAAQLGVDVDQAFEAMRKYARDRNYRIHDVAAKVIDGTITDLNV